MRSLPACKTVEAIRPILVDNASCTPVVVDSKGAKFGRFVVQLGGTDIALTALKLTECETSGGDYTDVVGTVFGTATQTDGTATTLPSATADGGLYHMDVTFGGPRMRYYKLLVTVGNGSLGATIGAWCDLYGMSQTPTTIAQRGAAQVVRV